MQTQSCGLCRFNPVRSSCLWTLFLPASCRIITFALPTAVCQRGFSLVSDLKLLSPRELNFGCQSGDVGAVLTLSSLNKRRIGSMSVHVHYDAASLIGLTCTSSCLGFFFYLQQASIKRFQSMEEKVVKSEVLLVQHWAGLLHSRPKI